MGLGYFCIFITILGGGALSVVLLKKAWKLWNTSRRKPLAVVLFLLAMPCAFAAIYLIAMIWREGLYHF